MKRKPYLLIPLLATAVNVFAAPRFDLIPLYGIRVNSQTLSYREFKLEAKDGGIIVQNEIPLNQEFTIQITKPAGFLDSVGLARVGYEYGLSTAEGGTLVTTTDIFKGMPALDASAMNQINLSVSVSNGVKPNSEVVLRARVFDRANRTGSYISYEFRIKVMAAGKALPKGIYIYSNSDTRGMKATSVGLHFNFFEFKGEEGNKFLYKIKKGQPIAFSLRGLEGWKNSEGKAFPKAEISLLSEAGILLHTEPDFMEKLLGAGIASDKKEITFSYKPGVELEGGKYYLAWLKLRDKKSAKAALDVVVKVYVQPD